MRRVTIEVVHVALGLGAALAIGELTAWSYPLGANDIWIVTVGAMIVIVLMGIGPIRRAWRADRWKWSKAGDNND